MSDFADGFSDEGLDAIEPKAPPIEDTPKRRARPAKSDLGSGAPGGGSERPTASISLFPNVGASGSGGDEKKRGRPSKSGNVDSMAEIFSTLHIVMADAFGLAVLRIDEKEARRLAKNIADVLEYYKITVSGKNGALLALAFTLTMMYSPRLVAIFIVRRRQKSNSEPHLQEPVSRAAAPEFS